jgi:hypothetical protein
VTNVSQMQRARRLADALDEFLEEHAVLDGMESCEKAERIRKLDAPECRRAFVRIQTLAAEVAMMRLPTAADVERMTLHDSQTC